MNAPIALTVASVALLLVGEFTGRRGLVWLAKPVASAGFVLTALSAGALGSPYGFAVLCALGLSWWGDVLLIPKREGYFPLGLGAFLLAHLAFAAAFFLRGVSLPWSLAALVALSPLVLLIARWLLPNVPVKLRVPVVVYMVAITVMVASAAGTFARYGDLRVISGAALFYLSDLSVARDRFVARGFANRLWGLPLYYSAQLLLALSSDNGI